MPLNNTQLKYLKMAQLQEQLDNSKKELNQEKIESNNFKEKVTSTLRATKQNTIFTLCKLDMGHLPVNIRT